MKKTILPVMAALSLLCITPAMAVPAFSTKPAISTDVLTVGSKHGRGKFKGNKNWNKHHSGKYLHGNRYWTHRYRYRPLGWSAYGCIQAGPLWYCP
jgi:hypothetical protein